MGYRPRIRDSSRSDELVQHGSLKASFVKALGLAILMGGLLGILTHVAIVVLLTWVLPT